MQVKDGMKACVMKLSTCLLCMRFSREIFNLIKLFAPFLPNKKNLEHEI